MDVTNFSGPARSADALIHVFPLSTLSAVFTRFRSAPIDVRLAVFTGKAVGTVARVIMEVIVTGGAVQTRRRIAFVNSSLAVRSGVSKIIKQIK